MLTGDKLETAENIARSCMIFTVDMQITPLKESNPQNLISKLL